MNPVEWPFIERGPGITASLGIETSLQIGLRHTVEGIYGPPLPPMPGLDVGRSYLGAAQDFVYGGDLVDVFRYGDGSTSIAVVDITGHGIAAAMHAGLVKHALRAYASYGLAAVAAVRALNRLCIENSAFEGEEDFFATLFYGIVSPDQRELTYVSAGHDAAFLVGASVTRGLRASGPVIGLIEDDDVFSARTVALVPGDVIVVATDGFTEARNADRAFLGHEALASAIESNFTRGAQSSAEAVTRQAFEFTGRRLRDDVAALVVRVVALALPSGGAAITPA